MPRLVDLLSDRGATLTTFSAKETTPVLAVQCDEISPLRNDPLHACHDIFVAAGEIWRKAARRHHVEAEHRGAIHLRVVQAGFEEVGRINDPGAVGRRDTV